MAVPPQPTPLQRLIADYIRDNPGENYSTIARRGSTDEHRLPPGTVQAIATRKEYARQTPLPPTIAGLARGMRMPESRVREAAGLSAGYSAGGPNERPEVQLLMATVRDLDPERLEMVLRRARLLHQEMEEERQARGDG